ncbi:Methyltransferase [Candidatus Sulfopaludibacter sp. SbA4]|nr:Methyltransferase [Candidatus Sulfopaludibacter sp. SbA4]
MEPVIRNISDTARWAAVFRARETDRPDALFRDPLARRLAGERGEHIANTMPHATDNAWAWIMRTYLFDQVIRERIAQGADMVVNLAAGLDARPFRMPLPASLHWVEIDLPGLLAYKEDILALEKPACRVERIALDLADTDARRAVFTRLRSQASQALVITEGLLMYLSEDEVGSLARDLAAAGTLRWWVHELHSPGLLRFIQSTSGQGTAAAGAPLKFGPAEGPEFFVPHGWHPAEVHSILQAAIRTKRLPPEMQGAENVTESSGRQGDQFWSGVCLQTRT